MRQPFSNKRDRHRRQPEKPSLRCRCHRARIEYIITQVSAGIYAGYDHIGFLVEQASNGQMDAIGGGAIHGSDAFGYLICAERRIER